MPEKEAKARIKINQLQEEAGWWPVVACEVRIGRVIDRVWEAWE
ncbi:MAG: hypothetical protein ACYC1M_10535 [Armatimonadota bacterium]